MSTDNLQLAWREEEHPPLELLRQYQEEMLPADVSHLIERHMLSCAICADIVEGLVLTDHEKTRLAVHDIQGRLHKKLQQKRKKKTTPKFLWADWRMAAAILVLVCSIALVYFYQVSLLNRQQQEAVKTAAAEGEQEAAPAATAQASDSAVTGAASALSSETLNKAPVEAEGRSALEAAGTKNSPPAVPHPAVAPDSKRSQRAAEQATGNRLQTKSDSSTLKPLPAAGAKGTTGPPTKNATGAAKEVPAPGNKESNQNVSSQRKEFMGRAVSSDGKGLAGVIVKMKDANLGASTDAQGYFKLPLTKDSETLQFENSGFQPLEISLSKGMTALNFIFKEEGLFVDEEVVVAYETHASAAPEIAAAPVPDLEYFKNYLWQNAHYAAAEAKLEADGKVTVAFTVMPDSSIGNFEIIESAGQSLNAAAIRLLKEGPAWRAATTNGTPVRQDVKVSIWFRH